jgi:GDPmannose 4,6-dehydratase
VEYRLGDVSAAGTLAALLEEVQPAELYHLAGESTPARMWEDPAATSAALSATVHVLHATRDFPNLRVLLAASSEVFGDPKVAPQDEETPLAPRNPYGAAKAFAVWMGRAYREQLGRFVATAILYNHESPRRPPSFVSRRITRGVADIAAGRAAELRLGNLEARRDWGFAGDYVDAMWRMLQAAEPADFVVGTGQLHTVRDFCEAAFAAARLDYRDFVVMDPARVRADDARTLVADASRARDRLGWAPTTDFAALVRAMVAAELER